MKISRTMIISQLVPERAGLFGRRLRAGGSPATLLSQFSREGEASSQSPGEDVLGAVGQQDERTRDRVIHMVERLEELRNLRDEFAILVEPLLALAREHPHFQSRLLEAETSLRHERAVTEALSHQINDLTHQKRSVSDELSLTSAQVCKQERALQEQETLIESLRRARQDAEMLADSLDKQLVVEAERAQATLTANEKLRAAAQEADQAVAQSERALVEARERIEVLEHDNQSLRKSTDDQAQRIGELTGRQGELDRQLADAHRQIAELEAKLAAELAERQKVEAQREADQAAAQTQAAAFDIKTDGLNARVTAADKILGQTRDQLREKNEALLISERSLKEASIELQRLERRLESMQQDVDRRVGEVEELAKSRGELTERAEGLARTVGTKNMAIENAEDKAVKLAERIDEMTARFKQERSELEAANRKLMEDLQSERSERALAQGALEISRENRAKIQKQLAALRRRSRAGRDSGDEPLLIDYAADDIESETVEPKPSSE